MTIFLRFAFMSLSHKINACENNMHHILSNEYEEICMYFMPMSPEGHKFVLLHNDYEVSLMSTLIIAGHH